MHEKLSLSTRPQSGHQTYADPRTQHAMDDPVVTFDGSETNSHPIKQHVLLFMSKVPFTCVTLLCLTSHHV